jgi:hypothetical protein
LDVDATVQDLGDHGFEFAIADQGVAADDRKVQRFDAVDDFEHAIDQGLAFEIGEAAQIYAPAQVAVVVGITAGAA